MTILYRILYRILAAVFSAAGGAVICHVVGWKLCHIIANLMDPNPTPGNDPMLAIGMLWGMLVGRMVFVGGGMFGAVCAVNAGMVSGNTE
jgi:hypothetical protein